MKLKDVFNECQQEGWVPLVVIRSEQTVIPCFRVHDDAVKFAKRNLVKGELWGTTLLTVEDLQKIEKEWIGQKSWEIELMTFPKLVGDRGKVDIETYYFVSKPDVYGTWGKKSTVAKLSWG
jgi:hypothetical protein